MFIMCAQFNGKFYDQIDGMTMGSPLGPLFVNAFMDEFENKHMEKLNELGVQAWLRFVDDVFAAIRSKECATNILEFLNKQHPNIKFTIEMEKSGKLPFLDTCVTRKSTGFSTNLYHKKTFTGVYLNWTSLTSRKYKISLIKCLCDRIWRICQDEQQRDVEIQKLRMILIKNQYPENIIEKEIKRFVERKRSDRAEQQQQPHQSPEQQPQPQRSPEQQQQNKPQEKQKRFIVLPYSNYKVEEFARRLTRLVNDTFPQVDMQVAFKAPNEIGKLFPFKDNIKETHMQSLVVYKIRCATCGAEYIGKTERILAHRIKEHNNAKSDSAIQMHKKEHPTHEIDATNSEILDKADNNFKLMLKEMLHINKLKPVLNTQHAAKYKNDSTKFNSQLNTIIIARQI